MNVRAIALSLPLALAAACTHSQQTGAASTPPPAERQATGGAATGDPIAQDPLFRPGPSIKGHAEDQVVAGRISAATDTELVIETPQGDSRTLQIAPETSIELDGMEAAGTDLTEGQPVRASFDVVEGQEIAVEIRAGDRSAGASESSQGTGSSSPRELGTGSSADPASPPAVPDPQTAPDAGWGPPAGRGAGEDAAGRPEPQGTPGR